MGALACNVNVLRNRWSPTMRRQQMQVGAAVCVPAHHFICCFSRLQPSTARSSGPETAAFAPNNRTTSSKGSSRPLAALDARVWCVGASSAAAAAPQPPPPPPQCRRRRCLHQVLPHASTWVFISEISLSQASNPQAVAVQLAYDSST